MSDHSLFGSLGQIETDLGTISIILIIVTVLLLEFCFIQLEDSTFDTPFQPMIAAIQKELMIVGTSAFILKIVAANIFIAEEWLLAIEIGDIIVPVTSFFFCLFGNAETIAVSLRRVDLSD